VPSFLASRSCVVAPVRWTACTSCGISHSLTHSLTHSLARHLVIGARMAVAILVLLECDGEQYTILTRQARVPAGYFRFPEIPAGMLDGSGHFAGGTRPRRREGRTGSRVAYWQ